MSRPALSLGIAARIKSLVVALSSNVLEAAATGTAKILMPERGMVVGIGLNVGRRGGTHSTSTIDVKAGSATLLAAEFDVAALTPGTPVQKEGAALAAAAAAVAKDETLSIIHTVSGGSSPTMGLVHLQIDYLPLGD